MMSLVTRIIAIEKTSLFTCSLHIVEISGESSVWIALLIRRKKQKTGTEVACAMPSPHPSPRGRGSSYASIRRLFMTNHNPLNRRWQFMQFAARKAGIAKHLFEFGKRVGIARRGHAEHHQAESNRLRRSNPLTPPNQFARHA